MTLSLKDRHELFQRFQAEQPNPRTELRYESPFELLIAVMLSAQATDVGVNKATQHLFQVANTPETMYALGEAGLRPLIKTINFFNTKAKHIIRACRQLIDQHNGQVPNNREDLEALPGVGRKTANVLLNALFKQPTMPVDTHVFRVANRTGLAPGKDVLAVEKALLAVIPAAYLLDAHNWLVLHGRYVCTAKRPKCGGCLIRDLCGYSLKTVD